jgi:hypothetical protein
MGIKPQSKGSVLTTTLTTAQYTVPASTTTRVEKATITNTNGADVTVTLSWTDTSASATYILLSAKSIAANDTYILTGKILEAGDILKGGASTTGVHLTLDYTEAS